MNGVATWLHSFEAGPRGSEIVHNFATIGSQQTVIEPH